MNFKQGKCLNNGICFKILILFFRLATNIKAADKTPQTPEQFDLGLDEFMTWMDSTEKSLDRLSDETRKTEVLENKDLCTFYLEEFRVS